MRVWVIKISEPLPIDGSQTRLFRAGHLAESIWQRGHEVTWWASTFDHFRKRHRFDEDTVVDFQQGYRIFVLRAKGYRKNLSIGRLIDHHFLARRFAQLAPREPRPDIIVSALPTIEFSHVATALGRHWNVPVVIDARDMWPDIFLRAFPSWVRPLARPALFPLFRMAKTAFRRAYAITGHSEGFVNWGLKYACRNRTPFDRHFPFGYLPSSPSTEELEGAHSYWTHHGLLSNVNQFIVCFLGGIGRQFDFDVILQAAQILKSRSADHVRFVVCGTGDRLREFQAAVARHENVIAPGWVGVPEKHLLMTVSSLALAPFISTVDFRASIPNKIPEYLSAGLPILTSLESGELVDLLKKNKCGGTYGESADRLARRVLELSENEQLRHNMAENAANLFESRFRTDRVYGDMVDYLEAIVTDHRANSRPRLTEY